jgi:hypothetical protein
MISDLSQDIPSSTTTNEVLARPMPFKGGMLDNYIFNHQKGHLNRYLRLEGIRGLAQPIRSRDSYSGK